MKSIMIGGKENVKESQILADGEFCTLNSHEEKWDRDALKEGERTVFKRKGMNRKDHLS